MTMLDTRTPAQRIAIDQDSRRQPIAQLLDWIADSERPASITTADLLPFVEKAVGHEVPLEDLDRALDARYTLRLYTSGSSPVVERVWDRLEATFDAELDRLLDLTRCGSESCGEAIAHGSSRVVCDQSAGAVFCDRFCHAESHSGGPCNAGTDR